MKPVLSHVLHESQFCQPGKNIGQLVTTVRDLHFDMNESKNDSFFVSIDFMKAFDNVDHRYIEKVLTRMKFPKIFVNAFMSMYKRASSKLLINGFCSKKISIKSGLRQGDPSSQDVFVVVENPLIEFLNKCQDIQKYDTLSNRKFLTLAYVDDANLVFRRLMSLFVALQKIELFRDVSGITLNLSKTRGVFYNKENIVCQNALPNICWVTNIEVLGVNFGSLDWVQSQWESKLQKCRDEIKFFKSRSPTYDAKAMLSKFKLGSLFTYIAQVFSIPPSLENKINDMLLCFIVPHRRTILSVQDLSLSRQFGGYGISDIVLHLRLCLLKPIITYMQERIVKNELSNVSYFVEYNLGQKLCSFFKMPCNSRTPHRFDTNERYQSMYQTIVKYNITSEELVQGKIGKIYHRILYDIGTAKHCRSHFYRLHSKVFPSYLKTFNYKVCFDLLPVKNKFYQFCLGSEVNISCPFCHFPIESAFHLFAKCPKLFKVWEILDETILVCFRGNCTYTFKHDRVQMCHFSFVDSRIQKHYQNLILYVNSIVNYNIWKTRNSIVHEGEIFMVDHLINKITASFRSRISIEKMVNRLTECRKVPLLQDFFVTLCSIKDATFDPG